MEVDEAELSIVVIIPEGEAPPAVMPITLAAADTVGNLKERIDANSDGQRPKAQQVLLCWGQELDDVQVVSQLTESPQSLTLLMKSDRTLSSIKMARDEPRQRSNSSNAIVQMLRQIQELQPRSSAPLPEPDPEAMKQLADLGFPAGRCKKALLLNGNNLEAAIEWIFAHQDDPDVDQPLTQFQIARLAATPNTFRPVQAAQPAPQAAQPAPQAAELVAKFEDLLQMIALGAIDPSEREAVERRLPELESHGWRVTSAVHRLWEGERNTEALSNGIDEYSKAFVTRMVELVNNMTGQ